MPKRAVIFANGEMPKAEKILPFLRPDDFLVAVDGGLRHIHDLHKTPNLLIGDLDSATDAEINGVIADGIEVRQFPVGKDETDLELALLAVVEKGFSEIILVAALGGRLDQTLGNLHLLMLPQLHNLKVVIENGDEEMFLIRKSAVINGNAGDMVSLIPVNGVVTGVETKALEYPLRHETLFPHKTRGISNVMLTNQAIVSIEEGYLLCIHTRKKDRVSEANLEEL